MMYYSVNGTELHLETVYPSPPTRSPTEALPIATSDALQLSYMLCYLVNDTDLYSETGHPSPPLRSQS